jgi:hypothetical protein
MHKKRGNEAYTSTVNRVLARVYKFGQQIRTRSDRIIVVSVLMALLAGIIWFSGAAWMQAPVDTLVNFRSLEIHGVRTVVTLDTLDPDTSTVVAHISTNPANPDLFLGFEPSVVQQIPELKPMITNPAPSEYKVYYQQPEVRDLSSIFDLLGLPMISQKTYRPEFDRVKDSLQAEVPHDRSSVLSIIGDPRMFPFDRYLIVCEVDAGAFLEYRKKIARIDSGYSVLPRFPGFVVSGLTKDEMQEWGGRSPIGRAIRSAINQGAATDDPRFWMEQGIAISAERPLYLRVLTIVLGIAAVVSIVFVYRLSEPSSYFLNLLGAFAVLWGVRSILTAGAPKSPNLIDFAVLALFISQIVLVTLRYLFSKKRISKDMSPISSPPP